MSDNELFIADESPDDEAWQTYLHFALGWIHHDPERALNFDQLESLEELVDCELPYELGLLLLFGVPSEPKWFDWRTNQAEQLEAFNSSVRDGLIFDVEENGMWCNAWGDAPESVSEKVDMLKSKLGHASPLLPLYGHRAMVLHPSDRAETASGNPVLSIHQSDIIVYGVDLAAWLHAEFGVPETVWPLDDAKTFPFWSDLIN